MGSRHGDNDEEPEHKVCLDPFWMGRFEVTQRAWERVMKGEKNPSKFILGEKHPVDTVSWQDTTRFLERLNATGREQFRLPSEAEWEYACRAGTRTPFSFGISIHTTQANYNGQYAFEEGQKGSYRRSTAPVGTFPPNPFGLYDMHGNVYEWVADRYERDYYKNSPERNPIAKGDAGYLHTLRGGSWFSNPRNLRCAYRYRGRAQLRNHGNGFRLVRIDR